VRVFTSLRVGLLALSVPLAVVAAPVPPAQPKTITNSIGMKLVVVPKGKFVMGMPKTEKGVYGNEPEHEVEITKSFHMGAYEVTQAEYEKVTKENPSQYRAGGKMADKVKELDTKQFPVEDVSWDEAVAFCKALGALPEEKKAGRVYRLPTEAEWEYACRAGTKTRYAFGDELTVKDANCVGVLLANNEPQPGALGRPSAVGSYKPNAWGLYDMHGNVWEWCSDWYGEDYYTKSPKQDPPGPDKETGKRVRRGGDFAFYTMHLRSGSRFPYQSDKTGTGFRVVCTFAAP
jgi:formylglycine-generating enzyme required for sulfatase activity